MISFLRASAAACLLSLATLTPGQTQNPGTVKVMPKLEPIAETRLLMEGLANPNFRGLERNLIKKDMDDQTWVYARGQALLIAETANLLMLRPPKTQGAQPIWFGNAMDLRNKATALAQELSKKDLARSKAAMQQLANSCNRCHQSFRVQVEITPFAPGDGAPVHKVFREEDGDLWRLSHSGISLKSAECKSE
jgi:hypothetical protein